VSLGSHQLPASVALAGGNRQAAAGALGIADEVGQHHLCGRLVGREGHPHPLVVFVAVLPIPLARLLFHGSGSRRVLLDALAVRIDVTLDLLPEDVAHRYGSCHGGTCGRPAVARGWPFPFIGLGGVERCTSPRCGRVDGGHGASPSRSFVFKGRAGVTSTEAARLVLRPHCTQNVGGITVGKSLSRFTALPVWKATLKGGKLTAAGRRTS